MATVVRPKDEKPRARKPKTNSECGIRNAELKSIPQRPKPEKGEAVTERTIWDLRQQIANALNRIDELEAQVLILARGGKEKEFYSVEEAAEIWGVSKSNLYLMIRQGRLPAIKIGEVVRIARGTLIKGPTN